MTTIHPDKDGHFSIPPKCKYSCHTINTRPHEGDDLPTLIVAAIAEYMDGKPGRRPVIGGWLKVVHAHNDSFTLTYPLNYRLTPRGTECRAATPQIVTSVGKNWLTDYLIAPFDELARIIADDFTCQFIIHRLTGDVVPVPAHQEPDKPWPRV